VRLSLFSGGVAWDRRDNVLAPTRGSWVTADSELAARAIGSEVGYIKTFFQASHFTTLSSTQNVLALRGQVGLARGFPRFVTTLDQAGVATTSETVQDLPISQRFFAGGSTTVRGFPLDRLGTFDQECDPDVTPDTTCRNVLDKHTGLSTGGNGVVVLNLELRRVVTKLLNRNLGAAAFLDAGNVFATASDLNLAKLRGSVGIGARYDSPFGPVRLDFGFKLDRRTIGDRRESAWEYHLSIGEAF
jgi:outer membrane protein assembly factor BamA